MKTRFLTRSVLLTMLVGLCVIDSRLSTAFAQGTAITYQGRLADGSSAASGNYDFKFTAYDAGTGGSPVGTAVTTNGVAVSNGVFTATLDFGAGVFTGPSRWLQIEVRTNGAPSYALLAPRQALTPSPYAVFAPTAGTAATAASATVATTATTANGVAAGSVGTAGLAAGAVDSSRIADGTIAPGDLSPTVLSNTFWRLGGNAGTSPGTQFIGTTDNVSLELRVNNTNALKLTPSIWGASIAAGGGANASGATAIAMGYNTTASGAGSVALGDRTTASGYESVALGESTTASGDFSTALGYYTMATNSYATALGHNSVAGGLYSLATGYRAKAIHDGAFVWADSVAADFASTASNQFLIRATNGVGINTNNPQSALHVHGTVTATNFVGSGAGLTTLSGGALVTGSVPSAALADNSVTSARILDGTVATADLANNSVTSAKIVDGTITGADLATDATGLAKVSGGAISSSGTSLTLSGNQYLNNKDILLRNDAFHGLGWYGSGKLFAGQNLNGPALYGGSGGALGSVGAVTNIALQWDASGIVQFTTNAFLNDKDLLLRDDRNHGVGWYGIGKPFAGVSVDGPVLYGWSGGGLGTLQSGGATNLALQWDQFGNVGIGTTSPSAQVHISRKGVSTTMPLLWLNDDYGYNDIRLRFSSQSDTAAYWEITSRKDFFSVRSPRLTRSPLQLYTVYNAGSYDPGITLGGNTEIQGSVTATAFNPSSDRNLKENFKPVNAGEVLEKVAGMPISEWNFKGDAATPHIGPMAQDFHATFGVGTDDKHIATVDADGVALAAIQGLNLKLEAKNAALEKQVTELKALVEALAVKVNGSGQ